MTAVEAPPAATFQCARYVCITTGWVPVTVLSETQNTRTDISCKELHRPVGIGRVVTSGSLSGLMVCTLARNPRDMDLISALGAIFSISITPVTMVSGQAMRCVFIKSTLYMYT